MSNSAFQQALVPAVFITVWLLPLAAITLDNRVQYKERALWLIACLFISWPVWVLYHFTAPLGNSNPIAKSGSTQLLLGKALAFYTQLAGKVHSYRWFFFVMLILASAGSLLTLSAGLRSVAFLIALWSAFFLILWSLFPASEKDEHSRVMRRWPLVTCSVLMVSQLLLSLTTLFTALFLAF